MNWNFIFGVLAGLFISMIIEIPNFWISIGGGIIVFVIFYFVGELADKTWRESGGKR